MQRPNKKIISFLVIVCLITGASAVGTCTFNNNPIPTECKVRCSYFGVNGDIQDPGLATAEYLSSIYPEYKDNCTTKWILEVTDSRFPGETLRVDWLQSGKPQPPITELLLHTCGLTSIETGAFSAPYLGSNILKLSVYYNSLNQIAKGTTQGLNQLQNFEWIGNGLLTRVDSTAVIPFHNSLEVMQISDCGFLNAEVVSNITGFCSSSGELPNLKSIELSFNPGPGLATISKNHFTQLSGVMSMYMWNSDIAYVENNQVFDPVARTIQTIDLSNNRLRTLPNGTLNSIIAAGKTRFTLALRGNSWACDCHLEWLQTIIRYELGNVFLLDEPICSSPASEAGKLLIEANMTAACPDPIISPPVEITCL